MRRNEIRKIKAFRILFQSVTPSNFPFEVDQNLCKEDNSKGILPFLAKEIHENLEGKKYFKFQGCAHF